MGVCRDCELRELPQPPQEGEMPVEQCSFQMRKSYSKGWGNTCWTRQRGCFQQGTAAKGLFTSRDGSGGVHSCHWSWELGVGSWELGAGNIPHPSSLGAASQGLQGWARGTTAARAEHGPGPFPTGTPAHASVAQSALQDPSAPEINLSGAEDGAVQGP